MDPNSPEPLANLHNLCAEIAEHLKLLRDYATTPGNTWLARAELTRINQLTAELEQILSQLAAAND
jgi:hypothetical protein